MHCICCSYSHFDTQTAMGVLHSFSIKNIFYDKMSLKVVSATFLLVSFLSGNESTYQTREIVFYFTLKALSIQNQILEFCIFKFHDVIKCLNIKQEMHFTE